MSATKSIGAKCRKIEKQTLQICGTDLAVLCRLFPDSYKNKVHPSVKTSAPRMKIKREFRWSL